MVGTGQADSERKDDPLCAAGLSQPMLLVHKMFVQKGLCIPFPAVQSGVISLLGKLPVWPQECRVGQVHPASAPGTVARLTLSRG